MLLWVASALSGMGVHTLYVRKLAESQLQQSLLVNAVFIWLIGWKVSQFVFSPTLLWEQPLALLYFHGGTKGAWLAGLLAALYLLYAINKHRSLKGSLLDSILLFLLAGYTSMLLLNILVYDGGNRWTLGMLFLLGVGVLARCLYRKEARITIQWVLIFVIGHALISTLASNLWEQSGKAQFASTVGLKVGQQAPLLEIMDSNHQPVRLSDFKGKTVILNFWASWCSPCRAEMPELQKFHEKMKDRDIVILAVNATHTESGMDTVTQWLNKNGYSFPVAYDAKGITTNTYRIAAFPATFIIGQDGTILRKHQGPMNVEMLLSYVRNI